MFRTVYLMKGRIKWWNTTVMLLTSKFFQGKYISLNNSHCIVMYQLSFDNNVINTISSFACHLSKIKISLRVKQLLLWNSRKVFFFFSEIKNLKFFNFYVFRIHIRWKIKLWTWFSQEQHCSWSNCNWTRTQKHLVRKRTLNHLVKLAKWLSCVLSTYL